MLTREHGKLEVVARGARRLTSKLMGHLEPLTLLRVSLARGRSLDVISEAEVITAFQSVKNDYQTTARALYVAELADGFSATEAPNPELFALTLQTLESVATHPTSDLRLRYFDLHLLNLSWVPARVILLHQLPHGTGAGKTPFRRRGRRNPVPDLRPHRRPDSPPFAAWPSRYCDCCTAPSDPPMLPDIVVPDSVLDEVNNVLSTSLQYWLDRQVNSKTFLEATKLS